MNARRARITGLFVLGCLSWLSPTATGQGIASRSSVRPPTYYNDGKTRGADPFVRYERRNGYYYAYSTDGADRGCHFAIYRSPDLAIWQRLPGGALPANDPQQWAHDWFWAPEVYHNEKTGVYFLFYSGRMNTQVAAHFQHPDFEEASKVGVAIATSPEGPFHNIRAAPIDYFPYDPAYHDLNVLMDSTQKRPPATPAEGRRAPRGTYLPYIDPNVYFDDDGRIYLYFSRNAYRNWVWDDDLGKYIEEANIYAVELDPAWWHDPRGATLPRVAARYLDANRAPNDPPGVRKDGFVPIISYGADKQAWENAHVDDYARTGGRKKDRRWAEGSTTIKVHPAVGPPVYLLAYSANNFENEHYGVGCASASSPLGPWRKSAANPILAQDPAKRLYSTGHGSIVASPDGREHFYVHHGRPSPRDHRRLYTQRLCIAPGARSPLAISTSTGDELLPSGVAPLALRLADRELRARPGEPVTTTVTVTSAAGAAFDLANPLNRVRAELVPASAGTATVAADRVTVVLAGRAAAQLVVHYQRQRADGSYVDVARDGATAVAVRVPIVVAP